MSPNDIEFFQKYANNYRGKWIAVSKGNLIGQANTLKELSNILTPGWTHMQYDPVTIVKVLKAEEDPLCERLNKIEERLHILEGKM